MGSNPTLSAITFIKSLNLVLTSTRVLYSDDNIAASLLADQLWLLCHFVGTTPNHPAAR